MSAPSSGLPLSRMPVVPRSVKRWMRGSYDALLARRAGREPLQHLTGSAAFRKLIKAGNYD